jgi:ergothioneine biosynthesis protein EgtB
VTWFFETFVLGPNVDGYRVHDPAYAFLFNSYYEAEGPRYPRHRRGMITRPGVGEVAAYRKHVDEAMEALLAAGVDAELGALIELGLHHEQQHQELLLMDIKHVLSQNPLCPAYQSGLEAPTSTPATASAHPLPCQGGLVEVGHDGSGFAFDNEGPRHEVYLEPYAIDDRLVTAGEWKAFIDDGGYQRPELWLSDGWCAVQTEGWSAPLYWSAIDGDWQLFTLGGARPVADVEPVVHVSHYEADAYARWAGSRLPTEFEWEHAVALHAPQQSVADTGDAVAPRWHPSPDTAGHGGGLRQLFGDVWQWTASAYLPYPRFQPAPGGVGEYNGKFMSNQMVLRGGCCATSAGHSRPSYRNFFPPSARWAFAGLRLAYDA